MGIFSRFTKAQQGAHQSAPRPTDEEVYLSALERQEKKTKDSQVKKEKLPIGREQVLEAYHTMQQYKSGKASLEQRVVENEQWYKMRHWESIRKKQKTANEPKSGWLFNCIENKHGDAMDNFPAPNFLPREATDKAEAKMLTSVVPVILDQNNFEKTYATAWYDKLKGGTSVYGVFWDNSKLNGLGDISIVPIDILSIFWEPGITDIQKSRNIFTVELVDNDILEETYPELSGKLSSKNVDVTEYIYDDSVDTSKKSAVIDWYYKKHIDGKTVLHYCKFVGDTVLFATENETAAPTTTEYDQVTGKTITVPISRPLSESGWYDHGKYPFVFDTLFPVKGTPAGFGYIDIGKSAQEYIDRGNQAIMQNMLASARPRFFIRNDGSVNEEEYADITKDFIHTDGGLGQDSILPVQTAGLPSIYVEVINRKIEEMKETTGNRDASTGGSSGATAASAIAAMQEAGSKLSRDHIRASYRVFREVCEQVVELIRQFYSLPRSFRIVGEQGAEEFVQYSNQNMVSQDGGVRVPLFDIEIVAEKKSVYSRMSQNEMALQFFGAGFFNPQISDQALACLDMMDFDRKDFVMQKIAQNGTMFQQMMQMQQQIMQLTSIIDHMQGTNLSQGAAQGGIGTQPMPSNVPEKKIDDEPAVTRKARQRTAEATNPQ